MIGRANELLLECQQLTHADTTAADTDTASDTAVPAERRRYDALVNRHHDLMNSISSLVTMATASIHKQDSLSVSC